MAKREHIPAKLRHEVFKRDNYRCRECGATNKETTLEIDHILPVSKGGSNDLSNLQTLCKKCNRAKHARTWVGGEPQKTNDKLKKTMPNHYKIVKCECGFKYNTRFHDSCPNCTKNLKKQRRLHKNSKYDIALGTTHPLNVNSRNSFNNVKKCPKCETIVNHRAKKCINCNYIFRKNSSNRVTIKEKSNKVKKCPNCGIIINIKSKKCFNCNYKFN